MSRGRPFHSQQGDPLRLRRQSVAGDGLGAEVNEHVLALDVGVDGAGHLLQDCTLQDGAHVVLLRRVEATEATGGPTQGVACPGPAV